MHPEYRPKDLYHERAHVNIFRGIIAKFAGALTQTRKCKYTIPQTRESCAGKYKVFNQELLDIAKAIFMVR